MNRLREERKKAKLTQAALSKRLNISQSAYSKYESGLTEPDHSTLRKLSKLFGKSVDYLLENEPTDVDTQASELVEIYENLSVETQNELVRYANFLQQQQDEKEDDIEEIS